VVGGDIMGFISVSSMMIVFGGTFAATLVNFPLATVLEVFSITKNAFQYKEEPPYRVIDTLVNLADKVRKEGILSVERILDDFEDPFMRSGIRMAVDGADPQIIRNILENELNSLEARHRTGHAVLHAMGYYAPAFGMLGTLIGLIQMLRLLEDPAKIGMGMAVALITTFYGALLANLVFLPLEGKLKSRTQDEVIKREMIIEGVLAIQSGDNPRIVRDKLTAFIAPKFRK
jgi:chemotaxis protein MotA